MTIHHLSSKAITLERLLSLAEKFAHLRGTCLFYSGKEGKQSILWLFPIESFTRQAQAAWQMLEQKVKICLAAPSYPQWVGYLGYELGASAFPDQPLPAHTSWSADLYFQRCALTIIFDHSLNTGKIYLDEEGLQSLPQELHWTYSLTSQEGWQALLPLSPLPPLKAGSWLEPPEEKRSYLQKVRDVKERLAAGDIYQMCLSQEFWIHLQDSAWHCFRHLIKANPTPFSVFFCLEDFSILSCSPERFLRLKEGRLETAPVKGTLPRKENAIEDTLLEKQLLSSSKERAELAMITDLMRNDLGRVCLPGTVCVQEMAKVSAYRGVLQMSSHIQGTLDPAISPLFALRSAFPPGSISGCPKGSAQKLIYAMEGRPRGIYTGAIGYFCSDGGFDFNVAIRTLVVQGNRANLQVGGGIVIDSDPELEYEETLHKARPILEVLGIKI